MRDGGPEFISKSFFPPSSDQFTSKLRFVTHRRDYSGDSELPRKVVKGQGLRIYGMVNQVY